MPIEIKTNIDAAKIVKSKLNKNVMTFAAEDAKRIMEPFVPMDTGTLAGTAQIEATDTTASVKYIQPYAAALYNGERRTKSGQIVIMQIRRERHPLATMKWDIYAMQSGGKEKLLNAVSQFIKRG